MARSALLSAVLVFGCGVGSAELSVDGLEQDGAAIVSTAKMPSENYSSTVDIGSWNVEWFGAAGMGPSNEALQLANASRVLRETNLDVVGLVEVVSESAFNAMLANLPAHSGLLVTDPQVVGGRSFYSAGEQKVALLFRKRFTVLAARVVMTEHAQAFGGRPPLEVTLSFTEAGESRSMVVVVAHFKALATFDGYTRRQQSALALQQFLAAEHATDWTLVVGDFNDDIDESTYARKPSPFVSLEPQMVQRRVAQEPPPSLDEVPPLTSGSCSPGSRATFSRTQPRASGSTPSSALAGSTIRAVPDPSCYDVSSVAPASPACRRQRG